MKMIKRSAMSLAMIAAFAGNALAAEKEIAFQRLWTHAHTTAGQFSEIPAFDKKTNSVWVAGSAGVDVLDASTGALVQHIDLAAYGPVNSIAIRNGLAAFAVEAPGDRRNPGQVVFFDTRTREPVRGTSAVTVGALPDMLIFTPDGSKLLVANEGTPNAVADTPYVAPDPAGTVSIIDVASRSVIASPGFVGVPQTGANLRVNTGMDFEPEYIAIDDDGAKAYVTLQEANGVAVLDLERNEFAEVIGLGVKDFSLADNSFGGSNFIDPSDRDFVLGTSGPTRAELRPAAVKGLYQPDSVVAYSHKGQTYLVMANEGDTREDNVDRVRASTIAGTPADLARLNVSATDSTPGNLVTFGARSFSIRDEAGTVVYDSGSLLDAEAIARGIYDDSRSDDKGVEPEGVALLDIGGRTYAFVGLERTTRAAVAVFDITEPASTQYIDMIVTDGDVSPEGLAAFHYRGDFFLAIANEVSRTTTLYKIDRVKQAD
jgi:DNA-binding beta-propeller fold protein YncE